MRCISCVVNANPTLRPFGLRLQESAKTTTPIGDRVFGLFPKVAHLLHEKSAKDGALCKLNKRGAGILSDSGIFWSEWNYRIPQNQNYKNGIWVVDNQYFSGI